MKFLGSQITFLLAAKQQKQDLQTFLKFLLFLLAVVTLYSAAFHLLMLNEGQEHSWITGVYWTLTVMSTLGFGDITFHSDPGRLFTIVVLLSGIVLLLIVLPFAFIRFFYAPWLEAQLLSTAPRAVDESLRDHVIICRHDEIARGLIERLELDHVPYVVIEPEPGQAAHLRREGVSVISGALDAKETYEAAGLKRARLLVANLDDVTNTNIIITAREIAESVPIVATALDKDAVDILELAGASHVLALHHRLGEHLASRVSVGNIQVHVVGSYKSLSVAEFPIRHTSLAGKTLREAQVGAKTGVTVAAIAKRGHLLPGLPDTLLEDDCIGVTVGNESQLASLNELLHPGANEPIEPVLIIGGGKVGRNAARALKKRGIPVHIIEENAELKETLESIADEVHIGDAANLDVILGAGLERAPSVILASDDATNIFLAVYCRKLNRDTIIVSRITHTKNVEAIHRAGADFAVSYSQMGIQSVLAVLQGRELTVLGEDLELFDIEVPAVLAGLSLREANIRARTELNVFAIERKDEILPAPSPDTILRVDERLIALGTAAGRDAFEREFG